MTALDTSLPPALFDFDDVALADTSGSRPGFHPGPFTHEDWLARQTDPNRPWWWDRHGWRGWGMSYDVASMPGHDAWHFTADLRCDDFSHREPPCQDVGGHLHRVICQCGWNSADSLSENAVVEEWNDMHWPGWRDLPILPIALRPLEPTKRTRAKLAAWLEEHQPAAFRQPGAPIRTERMGIGTRHVAGYSPFGGYDICARVLPEPPTRHSHDGGKTWIDGVHTDTEEPTDA